MSISQGRLAESVFQVESLRRQFMIYKPVCDIKGIDFIIQSKVKAFLRVQVKSSLNPYKNNRYKICVRHGHDSRAYTKDHFDYMACYLMYHNLWYIIPIKELNKTTIGINIDSPKCKYHQYKERWDLLT